MRYYSRRKEYISPLALQRQSWISTLKFAAERHGLIGENGSGKSTFSSIVAGIQQRDSGRLLLRGEDYAPTSSVDVCENGYEHHVCFVRGHVADILEEALTKYMGIPVYRHR